MKKLTDTQVRLLTCLTCVIWRVVLGNKGDARDEERIKKIRVRLYRAFVELKSAEKAFMRSEFNTLIKKTIRTTRRNTSFSAQGTLLLGIFAWFSPSAVNHTLSSGSFMLGLLWWKIFTDESMDDERFKKEVVFLLSQIGENLEKDFPGLDSAYKLAESMLK